jgi:uncharacterized membrane protein YjjP (DUF1212 family)
MRFSRLWLKFTVNAALSSFSMLSGEDDQKWLSATVAGVFGKTLSLMLGSRQRRASKEVSSFLFGKRQSL